MSDASDVLLIGIGSQQQATPITGCRIFGGSNFVRVDDACHLKGAFSEGDFHLELIGNPPNTSPRPKHPGADLILPWFAVLGRTVQYKLVVPGSHLEVVR